MPSKEDNTHITLLEVDAFKGFSRRRSPPTVIKYLSIKQAHSGIVCIYLFNFLGQFWAKIGHFWAN